MQPPGWTSIKGHPVVQGKFYIFKSNYLGQWRVWYVDTDKIYMCKCISFEDAIKLMIVFIQGKFFPAQQTYAL